MNSFKDVSDLRLFHMFAVVYYHGTRGFILLLHSLLIYSNFKVDDMLLNFEVVSY